VTHLRPAAPDLPALVRATVDRTPRAEAVVDVASGRRLDYAGLWDAARRVAGGVAASGVRPGDRVAIRLPNGADWCLAFLGAVLAGAAPVPVNTRLTQSEVDYVVADSGAATVIGSTVDGRAALPDGPPVPERDPDPEAPAALFYTSGTTGRPKGALLSHRALLAAAEQCRLELRLGPAEPTRNLIAAPLFHILACGMQWLPALVAGGAVVILPGFEVTSWLRTIGAERIDVLGGVPAMYWQALRHSESPGWTCPGFGWSATAPRPRRRPRCGNCWRRSPRRGWPPDTVSPRRPALPDSITSMCWRTRTPSAPRSPTPSCGCSDRGPRTVSGSCWSADRR
jgi:acyl-CoA synthetase (AMP-forming)/AMP-acid ligase II